MGPHIANSILSMVDPGVTGINISCAIIPFAFGWASQIESGHPVVLDLDLAGAFVIHRGRTEDVGIEEGLQVLICVLNEMSPIGNEYFDCCMLGEYNLF